MPRERSFDRQSFIDENLNATWRLARESPARYRNIHGHNVAVMPNHNNPGYRTWRLIPEGTSDYEWGPSDCSTEQAAKQAVLERLADKIQRELQSETVECNVEESSKTYCDRCGREVLPEDPLTFDGLCDICRAGWEKVDSP
jgi:RNA polymerase-binding transcription factor DksA